MVQADSNAHRSSEKVDLGGSLCLINSRPITRYKRNVYWNNLGKDGNTRVELDVRWPVLVINLTISAQHQSVFVYIKTNHLSHII